MTFWNYSDDKPSKAIASKGKLSKDMHSKDTLS
jgi:hypothetical protein